MTDLFQKASPFPPQTGSRSSDCSHRLDDRTSSHDPEGIETPMRPVICFRYPTDKENIDQRAPQGKLVGHARLVNGVESLRSRRLKRVK